jgi:aminocarboxymuconate-semialdehyde decarboxylase
MKFDLHTHFYTEAFFQTIRDLPSAFSFGTSSSGQTIITHHGARFFGVTPAMTDVAKMMNDSYADLIARHPKRFKGFASIPMDAPDAALAELHRALDTLKLNGVILLSNIGGRPLTSPEYRLFFEEANRMKLCIFLHPMIPAHSDQFWEYVLGPIIGFPFDTSLAVARMCYDGMFEELPDIRWIIGHLGGAIPYLMERMDNGFRDFADCRVKIDKLPSVYLKRLYYDTVSFSPYTLKMVRDMVGADHMVMGSDYPHLLGSIDRAVSSIETLDIQQEEISKIFSGTALSILNNT